MIKLTLFFVGIENEMRLMITDFRLTITTYISGAVEVKLKYVFEFIDLIDFKGNFLIFMMKLLLFLFDDFIFLIGLVFEVFHKL